MAWTHGLGDSNKHVVAELRQCAYPLTDEADLQPLLDRIGNSKIVMLGEASHGTHEYYTWRTKISKLLIEKHGFSFIAVEGDWPDCYRINRFIKGYDTESKNSLQVLHGFKRWPGWMWGNWEVDALINWLKNHNSAIPAGRKAGFYGLDVYSLWESMESIISYLEKTDPEALKVAEDAFRCFEPYRKDEGQSYARASMFVPEPCKSEVAGLLQELQRRLPEYKTDDESMFSAEQNAIVAVNAERYYRAMVEGGPASWNLRDSHMMDTLNRLLQFHGPDAKAIVWAHNTHIGDARATDMADNGMYNIGELARRQYPEKDVVLVGFGSYKGAVMAGSSWGAPMQVMTVPEAKKGSWEQLLHEAGPENKLIIMDNLKDSNVITRSRFGHRAIGVVYNPGREQWGNYVPSVLPSRYDAFIYIDETRALHPMHLRTEEGTMPETYPFGV